ncbi:uncharacterized protein LOC114129914 isoform X2 [Aphis gossypii]|uniref:uncharacterized protein LOC114129914 isoform X2 n=1 Tax=Aphis gossypii TaxID=80765 RepID=UPI0021599C0D|nr:uncharacterized protein LOC114129914 isoform X2 [Aphis gossypii]
MVATATLLLLFAIAFQTTTAVGPLDPPETFPNGHDAKNRPTISIPDPQEDLKTIQESCPPLGHPDERFKVTVLGTLSPAVGGCASMMKYRHDIVPGFNLWLGDAKTGGGSCDDEGLDHYTFECFSKHPLIENDTIKAWYVTLYDKTARWSGRKDYKCGLYSMLNEDPPLIQMIISANRSCAGLSQRMANAEHRVPEGFRHFEDGSVGLLLSKDWAHPTSGSDVWRKKRSAVKDSVHRFPDWSQGSWLDLQIDGGQLSYDTAYQEKDEVDYDQETDDEKDEDAEISGSEPYMQNSQRNVPVGASSRNRRSIPNINGVKMFRTRSSTIQNTKENKDWLKHQLFNENMRISDPFNFRRERRQIVPEKQKHFFNIFTQILPQELVENFSDLLGFGGYANKIAQPNKTTNMNHNFLKVLLDNNYRKKRDLENEGTKQRQKRCSGSSQTETTTARHGNWDFEHPPKEGDPDDPIYKDIKLLPQKRDIKDDTGRGQALFKEVLSSLLNIPIIRRVTDLKNGRDRTSNGKSTIQRKKREVEDKYSWEKLSTTTTERVRDLWTENPMIPMDLMEPFFWTTKKIETTPSSDYDEYSRKKRSTDEDLDEEFKSRNYEEEAALKKIKVIEEVSKLIRMGNVIRALPYISHRRHDQSNRDIKENEYELFPDTSMASVPSPAKYLELAKIIGIPYKEAVLKWRSLERKYRQQEAEADYAVYPGQNHPDIVMRDFDQTFDGIEYDFNPLYPEGTDEDPTAYRALTLPGGYRLEPRLSRRTKFEGKQLDAALESTTTDSNFKYIQPNSINDQKYTLKTNKRMRRSSTQNNQQQHTTTKFTWRCIMPVNNDEKQHDNLEAGAKFLTYGGRIEKTVENSNDQHNEQKSDLNIDDSKMSYGCLWLVPRGPNIIEFSIIGTGLPDIHQDIESFARQLCTEKKAVTKNSNMKNKKKFHIRRRPSWVTETRANEAKRVPVGCPVSPGIVFYGEIPAPPPSSTNINNSQPALPRLCVKLISSADDCTNGKAGPIDQMKYTKSECVEQDSSTGTSPQTVAGQQTIFEESRGHTAGESWRRNKRHSAPTDTSTVASSVISTSTSTDTLMLSGQGTSSGEIDNITSHQTTELTATSSAATTSYSTTPGRSYGSKRFVEITITDPTTLNITTTTATTFSTATSSTLPLSSSQQTTSPERQLSSFSPSTISTTFTTTPPPPFTSTATVTTTTSYYPVADHHYRQQQQWQQQHQQTNYNNNDYYYRGRQQQQQHYSPPPPGSTGTDYNNYYLQRQHQQPQTPSYWSPQQQVNGANVYSNGYQQRTTEGGGRRTDDYYYRQQQQNYYNHQYNNDRQHQTPQPPNSSLTVQHLSGGGWNVHGDRPLYISSGIRGDNNREALVARNTSAGISDINNGGWATPEQQHWWYQQQQQQQRQQEQQRQYHQRQQQNNRGLGGILSLPPVPLPPLHVEQGAVTVSAMPTSPPLHLRRPQKPPNHYYLPTLTTKTTTDHPYRLRSKSESRYYEEREYKCLGQWTEPQQHISPEIGAKPIMLTYMYVKRLNPDVNGTDQYECFVGTLIPNDPGVNSETTTTLLLTEAGSGTLCSRRADPYRTGMKLVGTKINKEGASFKSRQNERHPHSAIPPKTNNSTRIIADKRIIILLAIILFSGHLNNIARRYFN